MINHDGDDGLRRFIGPSLSNSGLFFTSEALSAVELGSVLASFLFFTINPFIMFFAGFLGGAFSRDEAVGVFDEDEGEFEEGKVGFGEEKNG